MEWMHSMLHQTINFSSKPIGNGFYNLLKFNVEILKLQAGEHEQWPNQPNIETIWFWLIG